MTDIRDAVIALYDRFTHEGMDRRAFMAELTRIAGGAAAASLALSQRRAAGAGRAGRSRADDPPDPDTRRSNGRSRPAASTAATMPPRPGGGRSCRWCSSSTRIAASTTIFATSTRRLALAGYSAVAPDFLSPAGGTPADEDAARAR